MRDTSSSPGKSDDDINRVDMKSHYITFSDELTLDPVKLQLCVEGRNTNACVRSGGKRTLTVHHKTGYVISCHTISYEQDD